jgi:putative endonuclease
VVQSFIYITTNSTKTVLYTGVTNDLKRRLFEHESDAKGSKLSFAGKYNCYHLIYFEEFIDITQAIAREKEIKGWVRKKKIDLINSFNADWKFLNSELL